MQLNGTVRHMNLLRNAGSRSVVKIVLVIAPIQCLPIQVCDVTEHPVNKEIILNKSDKPLNLALGKRVPRLAELRFKADRLHKVLVVFLPDGMPIHIPSQDNTFHVICQNKSRDTHILERMDHANKEILLSGVGKEFNISLSAVVTNHRKASYAECTVIVIQHIGESPVHLPV